MFASYSASAHVLNGLLPSEQVFIYCLMHGCIPWWVLCAVTGLVYQALRPWRPHQLIVLSLGMVLMGLIYAPATQLLDAVFIAAFGLSLDVLQTEAIQSHHASTDVRILPISVRDYAIWLGVNILFDRYVGLPRYRYPSARPSDPGQDASGVAEADGQTAAVAEFGSHGGKKNAPAEDSVAFAFLRRLEAHVEPASVIAIKAEQHYVKIITAHKSYMLLYRFGDVLAEIPETEGIPVHRSWWIRRDAIESLHYGGRRMTARLKNGIEVPISAPHQARVRKVAGWNNVPVRSRRPA